ncbi:hypothetical protein BLS_010175 [Venturia inaequalis]|uniref:Rab-GAP TBC domain-containing protein n=1 Tax=Venturia inaequalis TaxID=5025 RepID=A0A8H3YK41_VENIN|nr:hypothetical protein BLS_010175 [Venturia inaequalis]KAE9994407.1 hypothetical protein EG327_010033 [Venturia inaequalis]
MPLGLATSRNSSWTSIATPDPSATPTSQGPDGLTLSGAPSEFAPLEAPPSRSWLSNLRRPRTAPGPKNFSHGGGPRSPLSDDGEGRRDSALLPSPRPGTSATGMSPVSTARTSTATTRTTGTNEVTRRSNDGRGYNKDVGRESSLPQIVVHGSQDQGKERHDGAQQPAVPEKEQEFGGLPSMIPTEGFEELVSLDKVQFSTRGSMLLDGKRAAVLKETLSPASSPKIVEEVETATATRKTMTPPKMPEKEKILPPPPVPPKEVAPAPVPANVSTPPKSQLRPLPLQQESVRRQSRFSDRVLTIDEWELSQRVRSMYEFGNEKGIDHGLAAQTLVEEDDEATEMLAPTNSTSKTKSLRTGRIGSNNYHDLRRSPSFNTKRESIIPRERYEFAGGIEDWEDVGGDEVDRYGFILPKLHPGSRGSSRSAATYDSPGTGLEDIAVAKEGGKEALMMKKKEWRREGKWRKMGKATLRMAKGGGMLFDFDPRDAKVVSRTWKGIPDKWRASAWWSFLAASAKRDSKSLGEDELIELFYELQEEGSADDVQIDCDVPRTINRHIMFRRRYRGGQRLLFRVLHALSLYFPDTGYVQGMAALAATFLCYYDEEQAFVMMEDLNITSTAYGTRWYLTLFNYSIPFPAQLRVWDVFLLLGDVSNCCSKTFVNQPMNKTGNSFGADLDVLHATSAALIDATREVLLDSDFEGAMKCLTSWIPVKDEDLLMKVALAEWRLRKKRGG